MLLFHNVQLYYQSVTLAQGPTKLFKLYYIVENHKPSMHSEECTIMSDCVKETLDYSEYTVIKSA